jgi:hypothetical protein
MLKLEKSLLRTFLFQVSHLPLSLLAESAASSVSQAAGWLYVQAGHAWIQLMVNGNYWGVSGECICTNRLFVFVIIP